MKYRGGDKDTREYDFCHYEVSRSAEVTDKKLKEMKDKSNGGSPKLFFKVTKMTEINVYIYGGSSRDNATEKITDKNKAVEINKEYSVDVDTGIFIVAFPNKN